MRAPGIARLLALLVFAAAFATPADEPAPKPAQAPEQGIVLLGPKPPAAVEREQLAPGITVLGPAPGPPGPRSVVRVEVQQTVETGDAVGGVPDQFPLVLPRRRLEPALVPPAGSPSRPASRTVGPGVEEQQRSFGRPPPAPSLAAPYSLWQPASAWPEADPRVPYPWNPVTFPSPTIDWTWTPAPAWPPGQDVRNWSPSSWSRSVFDFTWRPSDSWGRSLAAPPEEPAAAREPLPAAPAADQHARPAAPETGDSEE